MGYIVVDLLSGLALKNMSQRGFCVLDKEDKEDDIHVFDKPGKLNFVKLTLTYVQLTLPLHLEGHVECGYMKFCELVCSLYPLFYHPRTWRALCDQE